MSDPKGEPLVNTKKFKRREGGVRNGSCCFDSVRAVGFSEIKGLAVVQAAKLLSAYSDEEAPIIWSKDVLIGSISSISFDEEV